MTHRTVHYSTVCISSESCIIEPIYVTDRLDINNSNFFLTINLCVLLSFYLLDILSGEDWRFPGQHLHPQEEPRDEGHHGPGR
jgi:hypothetical protein